MRNVSNSRLNCLKNQQNDDHEHQPPSVEVAHNIIIKENDVMSNPNREGLSNSNIIKKEDMNEGGDLLQSRSLAQRSRLTGYDGVLRGVSNLELGIKGSQVAMPMLYPMP